MKKIRYIPQIIQTECGLCCAAMISRYYGNYVSLNDLRDYLEPGRDGIDIKSLKSLLIMLNFDSRVFKVDVDNIANLSLPCILFWEKKHYVILERILKKHVIIVDPALGRLKISKEDFKSKFSNIAITALPTENFHKNPKGKSTWLSYINIIMNNKNLLCYLCILSLINYGFSLVLPIITQRLIDSRQTINDKLILAISTILFFYILILFLRGKFQAIFRNRIYRDLSKEVFKKLINLPYNYFETRSFGSLLFSLECIGIVKNLYSEKLLSFFINIGAIIVLLFYLMYKAPILAIIMIILLISMGIILKSLSNKVLMYNQMEIVGMTKLQSMQAEMIYSMLNIKISGIEDKVYEGWLNQFENTLSKTIKRDLHQNYYGTLTAAFQTIVPTGILIFSLGLFAKNIYTLGQVISFYAVINNIAALSTDVFTTLNYFELSSQYLERVKDITEQKTEENGHIRLKNNIEGKLVLDNVSFRYNRHSQYVLKNISMNVELNKKIAIVGKSGSGKSTLGKLIVGLYEPSLGNIYFNGENVKNIDRKHFRRLMGIVPQDNTLFNKTIFENIVMNRDYVDIANVKKACKIAQIDREIESMPMKYNTLISDMGMNISGGQRQRILLARALASEPKLILFDEATSSLDTINESNIFQELKESGCTRIIIAHRLSTIRDADYIYVMDDGRIVEEGKHDELLLKNGLYAELYKTSM